MVTEDSINKAIDGIEAAIEAIDEISIHDWYQENISRARLKLRGARTRLKGMLEQLQKRKYSEYMQAVNSLSKPSVYKD